MQRACPDDELLNHCRTAKERTYVRTIQKHGIRPAAEILGVDRRTLQRTLERLREVRILAADAPEHGLTHGLPAPLELQKLTRHLKDGEVVEVWEKSAVSGDRRIQLINEAVDAFKADVVPAKLIPFRKKKKKTISVSTDLLNLHIITDFHIGMYAWPDETRGDPWNTDLAADLLYRWFEYAIRHSPPSAIGVLCNLGDFLHFDGLAAITPTSGHLLDADTRYQRVVRITIRLLRQVIALLLTKHELVHVIMGEGNHDRDSSPWLREMLHAFFDHEPRVFVDTSPDPYYCIEHGDTSLFFHHGHLRKMETVDRVFASKFRDVFGRTKHSFGHTGHLHHRRKIEDLETSLMPVEQHRTLAPSDSHGSRGGWGSGREAPVITYHKQFGEVGRSLITPEMLRAAA